MDATGRTQKLMNEMIEAGYIDDEPVRATAIAVCIRHAIQQAEHDTRNQTDTDLTFACFMAGQLLEALRVESGIGDLLGENERKLYQVIEGRLSDALLVVPGDKSRCPKCGQADYGQTGEYACSVCGLPTVHDMSVDDALRGAYQRIAELEAERAEMIDVAKLG